MVTRGHCDQRHVSFCVFHLSVFFTAFHSDCKHVSSVSSMVCFSHCVCTLNLSFPFIIHSPASPSQHRCFHNSHLWKHNTSLQFSQFLLTTTPVMVVPPAFQQCPFHAKSISQHKLSVCLPNLSHVLSLTPIISPFSPCLHNHGDCLSLSNAIKCKHWSANFHPSKSRCKNILTDQWLPI